MKMRRNISWSTESKVLLIFSLKEIVGAEKYIMASSYKCCEEEIRETEKP